MLITLRVFLCLCVESYNGQLNQRKKNRYGYVFVYSVFLFTLYSLSVILDVVCVGMCLCVWVCGSGRGGICVCGYGCMYVCAHACICMCEHACQYPGD